MMKGEGQTVAKEYCMNLSEEVFQRWYHVGEANNVSDLEVASFLLGIYDLYRNAKGEFEQCLRCCHCQTALSLYCTTCQCLRQPADQPLIPLTNVAKPQKNTGTSVSSSPGGASCSSDDCECEPLHYETRIVQKAECSAVPIQKETSSVMKADPQTVNTSGTNSVSVCTKLANETASSDLPLFEKVPQPSTISCNVTLTEAKKHFRKLTGMFSQDTDKILHKTDLVNTSAKRVKQSHKKAEYTPQAPTHETRTSEIKGNPGKFASSAVSKQKSLWSSISDNIPAAVNENGQYVCTVCHASLGCLNRLKTHYRRAHTSERPYPCDLCSAAFAELFDLKRHINNKHTGTRPYACNRCGKAYFDSNTLKRHIMRLHTHKRPHVCQVCGAAFFEKSELSKHVQRLHEEQNMQNSAAQTATKPYLCSECGACFGHKSSLNSHMNRHSGLKPFSCSVCGNRFRAKSTLRCHMKIHTDDRRFVCELCGEKYITKSALTVHKRKHFGERPYICDGCNKGFYICGDLKKHRNSCVKIAQQKS